VQIPFAQLPQKIIFSKLTKKEGLASESVFHTVQDKTGYLWIATQNGLQRYDGNRFITFRHIPGDSTTIPDNSVNHLFVDSKNRLWLLFEKAVGIFNTSNNSLTTVKISSSVNLIKKLMEDRSGKIILFADYNKRLVYDEEKKEFMSDYPLPAMPGGLTAGDMIKAASPNRYWLTGKQGLFLYDASTKQYSYKNNILLSEPIIGKAGEIINTRLPFVAKDGNLWMVSWIPFGNIPTLYCFDKTGNTISQFEKLKGETGKDYYEIWGLYQQSNGVIWVYGMGLLAYYNPALQHFNVIKNEPLTNYGIEYDYVSNLFEDREKNMWVSTNKGLFRFNIAAQVFTGIANRRPADTANANVPVTTILQTNNNGTWISTWGAGIFSYDKNWQPIANPVDKLSGSGKFLHASYMMQRSNGEIWVGTRASKIKIYDPAINKLSDVPVPLEENDAMRQILEDDDGNVWIGSDNGILLKCPGGNWKNVAQPFIPIAPEASFGDILKLYIDKNNFLWICTGVDGVYKIERSNGKILQHYKESTEKNNGLLKEGATDIVQYNDSLFLIASNSLCILNSNTNTFRYLTAADGLPAENIINITIDKKQRIWIALAGGLYRLNLDKKLHVEYDAADGITNNIFEVSTDVILNDNHIALGTTYDFMLFDPEKTIDTSIVPPVSITNIIFSGRQVSVDSVLQAGALVMPYDNTAIEISLSTLSFRNHYRINYMLKGIDTIWRAVGANNEIVYPYLPPGNYTLLLKAVNGEGAESKTITSLNLDVNKPFWLTWWFYSLLILVAGAVLFWLDKERMERKEALQTMRSNIATNLHKDISTALSDINVLSEMAKLKADKEPQKSIEFIEQIHSRSGNMMNAVEDMMWAITPENDSMQKALNRLKEHVDMLRNKHNVSIYLLIDKKIETLNLNMKQRQDIYWFLKNGVNNITHTGAANIRMHLGLEKMLLVCTLEFDNSNMDMLQFNNLIQRKELADKLKEVNGVVNMNTIKTGSVIELKVPV
jgi:ligand-binding sensor domain-containing protein/signal transduction histidine kinase